MATPRKPWDDHRSTTLTVRWTNNYGLFETLDVNRDIKKKEDDAHVAELMEDISEHGYRPECPIFVVPLTNGKLGILNGQHRFLACKALGLEVGYWITNKPFEHAIHDVMIDHSLTKAWTVKNFLNFYRKRGNPHYKLIYTLAAEHGISEADAFKILTAANPSSLYKNRKELMSVMKRGNLKFEDGALEAARVVMAEINKVRFFHPTYSRFHNGSACIQAICELVTHPGYDSSHMAKQLELQPSQLTRCGASRDYLRLLEKIYNARRKAYNHISLLEREAVAPAAH